jgi:VCBS repeat-containing protein
MSGSDVQATFIAPAVADPDGISTAATLSEAGNLTINGALADGGSVTFDQPRNVTILSASNDTGDTFTVTGTDETGAAQTEAITGANSDTAVGAPVFRDSVRLRGLYVVNSATAGTIAFHEGSSSGSIKLKFNTIAGANTTAYPDIPDSGIRCVDGGYVVYTQTHFSSMTVFYA